jgi:hypothetical protein
MKRFGTPQPDAPVASVPQASADLTQYRELAPENIRYDASGKRYLRTEDFRPRLLKPNEGIGGFFS